MSSKKTKTTLEKQDSSTGKSFVAYVPVLHQGYLDFFARHSEVQTIFLLDRNEFIEEFPELRKDLRALPTELMRETLELIPQFTKVEILHRHPAATDFAQLAADLKSVVMPDEDISHAIAAELFADIPVEFDHFFLRWDKKRTLADEKAEENATVTTEELHQQFIARTTELAKKSPDWWRQIGCVIARDGEVIAESYNHAVPSAHQQEFDGDPRGNFHAGENYELSTAIHAEAEAIAAAARDGKPLQNAEIYVTTFPCPTCAKLIAASGIQAMYFRDGYAKLDGESVLKTSGVKILRVV